MTRDNYPSELVEDLSPIGVPMHLHLEELRADVGHLDSSFKNLRRTADLLLPLLDSSGIREPSDLDDPIARSRLLEVMTEEAPKGVEGQLVAGTPESLERRLSEFRKLLSIGGVPASRVKSLKRSMRKVAKASGLRIKPREVPTLEEYRAFFDAIEDVSAKSGTIPRVRLAAMIQATGRRRSEILGLVRSDVSTHSVSYSISKARSFPEEVTFALEGWFAPYVEAALEAMPGNPAEPLVKEETYQRITRAAWVAAGNRGRCDLHAFRHYALDAILDADLGIEVGAAHLGHRDVSTTAGYQAARRMALNRSQAARPSHKAIETIYGLEGRNDAPFEMPAVTREVDGSLTLHEVAELGGHEFDRLYPVLSSGPMEVEGHKASLTIYSNHRLGTKTDRWGFTEPLDYEFAMSNPTVMITEFDGTTQMIGASGSLLDEAIAKGMVGDTGFEPVSPA